MAKYLITNSDGRKFQVESSDPQTAYNDLNTHLSQSGQPTTDVNPLPHDTPVGPKVDQNGDVSFQSTAEDAAKGFGAGLVKGAIQMAALPRSIADATQAVGDWAANKVGVDPSYVDKVFQYNPTSYLPSEQQLTNKVQDNVTGQLYQPQTTVGKVSQTIGEFAPNAIGGGGGILRKAAAVALPALASEAAGAISDQVAPQYTPYAKAAGALAGGLTSFLGSEASATSKALSQAALDKQGLMAAKNNAYAAAQQTLGSQQVPVQDFADMVRGMNQVGAQAGLGGALGKTTQGLYTHSSNTLSDVTDYLREVAAGNAPPPTYGDLENMRQVLGDIKQSSKDIRGNISKDGYLAGKLQDVIDNTMGSNNPYADARQAFQTMRKTQLIDQAIQNAQDVSSGVENGLRNEFNKLIRSNVKTNVFSPDEIAAMRRVTGSVGPGNIVSILGKFGVSGDRIAALLPAAGGAAGATVGTALLGPLGAPIGAGAELAAASAVKKYATAARSQAAEDARNVVALGTTGQQKIANQLSGDLSAINQGKTLATAEAAKEIGNGGPGSKPPRAVYRNGLGQWFGYDTKGNLVPLPAQ